MVHHQAPAQQPYGDPFAGGSEELDEGGVVFRLVKDLRAGVPPVENVITPIPQRRSCGPRHERQFSGGSRGPPRIKSRMSRMALS